MKLLYHTCTYLGRIYIFKEEEKTEESNFPNSIYTENLQKK